MRSSKFFAKSRTIRLLIGLVLLTMIVPVVVSAASISSSITVTSPNGGETWQRGSAHTVTWDYSGSPGSTVKIVLLKAGVEVGTISAGTSLGSSGKGSYTWAINPSASLSTGSDYKVKVQSINQPGISDTSNSYFTLTPAGTAPSLTVTAPDGGENWQRGTCHPVTWSYTGTPGSSVKIVLLKAGSEVGTASASTSIGSGGKGSYTWCISSTRAPDNDYKISVQSVSQPTLQDTSTSNFAISAVSSVSAVTPPAAQFTANTLQGQAPLTVQFTDQTAGTAPLTYAWDFNNDGVIDSTVKSPSFVYKTAGTSTVKLTVTNANGSDSEVKTNYITVSSPTTTETFGAEPNPTGNPLGGGTGYTRIISETDTSVKYVVSTKDAFLNALKSAKSGEVIFVKGTANIDLTGTYGITIPEGVTLASNRGSGGSSGGRIFLKRLPSDPTTSNSILNVKGDNVRITGLRIEGPDSTMESKESVGSKTGVLLLNKKGFEIDNCEISGYSTGIGVAIWDDSLKSLGLGSAKIGRDVAYIHHNYIHHCQSDGSGYGIMVNEGAALVEANRFDYTRHAITGTGKTGEGYEAAYNIHLGNTTNNVFDVHPYPYTEPQTPGAIAGDTYKIHHNTFYSSQPTETHVESYDVIIRAVPVHGMWIDHNKMQWYGVYLHPPVAQSGGTGRVYMTKNLIGPNQVLYANGPIEVL